MIQSHNQPTAKEDEAVPDLTDEPPQPRAIHYQEPSFSLEQPDHMLKMHERIEVHNNYISAISNKLHTIDLIDRLKKNEPHNAAHYQAELGRLLVCHDDVINRVLNIMKVDDYRQVEELPVIDPMTAYDEINATQAYLTCSKSCAGSPPKQTSAKDNSAEVVCNQSVIHLCLLLLVLSHTSLHLPSS